MSSDEKLIVFRLRRVAKRTPENSSDHDLLIEAADALEAAEAERDELKQKGGK